MMDFEDKLRKAVTDIQKYGLEFAELKPLANNLDELKKTILSEEILKCEPNLSLGEKDARARISKSYISHLSAIKDAEHAANCAYARLEAARARFEALRSLCSMEKKLIDAFEYNPNENPKRRNQDDNAYKVRPLRRPN